MNRLRQAAQYTSATVKKWTLRTGHALSESISKKYERRSERKSDNGRHAKSISLLEKAQRFSASVERKSDLGAKVTLELVKLAEEHESEAAWLKKSFVSSSSKREDQDPYRSPVPVPRGISDANALDKRLKGMEPRLEEARNLLTAAYCRAKAAERYEKEGKIAEAISQLEKAKSDYYGGLMICSETLRLPRSFRVFASVALVGEPSKEVSFGDTWSYSIAVMEKLRTLSGSTPRSPS